MSDPDKHDATHAIDQYCCAVLKGLTKVIPAASAINAKAELGAVYAALLKLHEAADRVHVLLFADCGGRQ